MNQPEDRPAIDLDVADPLAEIIALSGESPAMVAVRLAMQAATEAADARAREKAARKRGAGRLQKGEADWDVIAATALDPQVLEPEEDEGPLPTFELGEAEDLDTLVAELASHTPELPSDERHGDLVIIRPEDQAKAWYELAAESALPLALRDVVGPIDVKQLLSALLIEIGDVKRTNAMLMEQLARIEEKVDRTNRHLRPKG